MTIRQDVCKVCGLPRYEKSEMRFCQQHHNEYHARKQRESQSAAEVRSERMQAAYARLHVRELVDLTKGAA
jgi:uncharacterized Zn finger protein (UPF0148 family)